MNDAFDVMNIRSLKNAIRNDPVEWAKKRKVLDTLLRVLENTERMYVVLENDRKDKEREERNEERRKQREKEKEEKNKKKNGKKRKNSIVLVDVDDETDSDEEDDLFKDPDVQKKEAADKKKAARKKRKSNKTYMFASQTTMEGWRLTIKSMIDLIEELFDHGYKFVLTAMCNQDIIEVSLFQLTISSWRHLFNNKNCYCLLLQRWFGQMRYIDMHPTCRTVLYIFRMLALYSATTKVCIRNANVDQEENIRNISSYKKCLVDRYKHNTQALEELKYQMEAKLLNELTVRFINECDYLNKTSVDDLLVYDLCGYMLKARPFLIDGCDDCKKSLVCKELELPENFCAANYVILKNKGGLIFVTIPFFLSFCTIEAKIADHFANETDAYKSDSYEVCIEAISESNIHPLFCAAHRDHSLPVLIMEYVHVRYYFESKRYKNLHFSKSNKQCTTDDKKKKSE